MVTGVRCGLSRGPAARPPLIETALDDERAAKQASPRQLEWQALKPGDLPHIGDLVQAANCDVPQDLAEVIRQIVEANNPMPEPPVRIRVADPWWEEEEEEEDENPSE